MTRDACTAGMECSDEADPGDVAAPARVLTTCGAVSSRILSPSQHPV
jgi:hypothetical protein